MAAHDYAADTDNEELISEVRALVRLIHRQVGAPDPPADDYGPATQRLRQARSDSSAAQAPAGRPLRVGTSVSSVSDQGPWPSGACGATFGMPRRRPSLLRRWARG